MILFSNIIRRPLACAFLFFLALSQLSHAALSAEKGGTGCPGHRPSSYYLYQNVKRVALWLDIPALWQIARDCHGREEECAENSPDSNPSSYIRELRKAYQPHERLSGKFLEELLVARIKQRVLPALTPDHNCQTPALITKSDDRILNEPGTLVIYVQVKPYAADDTHQAVVLRTVVYRPEWESPALISALRREHLTAIDLTWPDPLVNVAVDDNIQELLRDNLRF